ncbi:putative RNA-dependent RNA polymerase 1 [Forsythia ovata]|uniref:RNA-dependent RNA polymerase 1 n=1 Tax=Forsythia ovata TaxID=205694 RepID=A0ABD1WNV9_9LAMI
MGRQKRTQNTRANTKRTTCPNPRAETRSNIEDGISPVRKRARIGKRMHILPPSESDLNGFLQFTKKNDKDRYKHILDKASISCKYIHKPTMAAVNIETNVLELIDNIGW